MVLIYKKTLSIKHAGSSNDKIINSVNLDAEKIGDFCSYIHRVWWLPVQVLLASIILYRNLGGAPSTAASFATVLVMVCNTPLAKMQKKASLKDYGSQGCKNQSEFRNFEEYESVEAVFMAIHFLKNLLHLRETKRNWLKRYPFASSAMAFLFWASPTFVFVFTFGVYMVLNISLTAGTIPTLATFRVLQETIYNLPKFISMVAQTKACIDHSQ